MSLYQKTPSKCVVGITDEVELETGDIVIWEITNKCTDSKTVTLAFAQDPLNKKCKVKDKVERGESLLFICRVTKAVSAETRFKYSIRAGDYFMDPKLVVRPPGSLCALGRKLVAEHCPR